eukprot:14013644-Alexandrium_andersonii.AAC.1
MTPEPGPSRTPPVLWSEKKALRASVAGGGRCARGARATHWQAITQDRNDVEQLELDTNALHRALRRAQQ